MNRSIVKIIELLGLPQKLRLWASVAGVGAFPFANIPGKRPKPQYVQMTRSFFEAKPDTVNTPPPPFPRGGSRVSEKGGWRV